RRSLFFPCSADHRRLHSFPTRRSSDLIQTVDWYAGGFVNFDTNIDSDDRNCLLCQSVFYQRFGGVYYNVAHWATYTYGIDPAGYDVDKQRTFGALVDPNGSVAATNTVTGDEQGVSGFT